MASKAQLADLDFENAGRVRGLLNPSLPQDAATKDYVDGLAGGSVVVTSVEVDFGALPVKNKTVTIIDAAVLPTTKIMAFQAGRAATGRPADENEWTRLSLIPSPETGQFKLWVSCLTGRMRGKFIIDYIKG